MSDEQAAQQSVSVQTSDTPIEPSSVDNGDGTTTHTIPIAFPKLNADMTASEHMTEIRKMERWFGHKVKYLEGAVAVDFSEAKAKLADAIAFIEKHL